MSTALEVAPGLAAAALADGHYHSTIGFAHLPRLAAAYRSSPDAAGAALQLAVLPGELADGRTAQRLRGTVTFAWQTDCQRCLAALELDVVAPFDVILADDADDTAEDWDAWTTDIDTVALADILDEYALLALPLAPRHADTDCSAQLATPQKEMASSATARRQRPFSELKNLLNERDE